MSATLSPKDAALAKCWAVVKQPMPDARQGLPSKTWADMPLRTRAVLVMLGGISQQDPREVARQPWLSLSESDRDGIAACARAIGHDLKNASCLF